MLEIPKFNLYLIRHGESETNAQPDKMGQTSFDPLTKNGEDQARKLNALFLKRKQSFDHVFTSSYKRAYDTSYLATHGINQDFITSYYELREYDPGHWLGASRSQVITPEIKYKMNALGQGFLPPNGESLNQVQRRASAWLDDNIVNNKDILKESNESDAPLEIAVFSHGLTIKCLLQYVMGFDKIFTWKIIIDNTSVSKLSFGNDGWKVHSINDCSHLE
jgi:broad specificity phosphatase PhoE